MNPINSEIIDETTKKFADDPEVAKRLLWWLRNGHSCERWFQFEWAYKLQLVLKSRYQNAYSVGCERDYIDIVIYQQPFTQQPFTKLPLNKQNVFAGIEIKWCGNWATTSSIEDMCKDLEKIRTHKKYCYPTLALSVWLWATPSQSNDPFYSWISQQIQKEKIPYATLREKLLRLMPVFWTESFLIDGGPAFQELKVFCIGFSNERMKSADSGLD